MEQAMDTTYLTFVVVTFLAVVFVLEGLYHTFFANKSREVKRIRSRLAQLKNAGQSSETRLLREEEEARLGQLARWLSERSWGNRLNLYVRQADAGLHAADLLLLSALLVVVGVLVALLSNKPVALGMALGLASAALPWWFVSHQRDKRVRRLEQQLPEALDMMARAMRAGHALSVAIKMCGDELAAPLGPELRDMSDQVTLGIPFNDALKGLIERVPLREMSFMAVALSVQRETGGNLAELLDNLSHLMRDRFKLIGEVRIKSAEGRTSAWILGLLPFTMGALMMFLNPAATALLWTDPTGRTWLTRMLILMGVGIFWITRIVRIRA